MPAASGEGLMMIRTWTGAMHSSRNSSGSASGPMLPNPDLDYFDLDSCRVEPGDNPFGPRVSTM